MGHFGLPHSDQPSSCIRERLWFMGMGCPGFYGTPYVPYLQIGLQPSIHHCRTQKFTTPWPIFTQGDGSWFCDIKTSTTPIPIPSWLTIVRFPDCNTSKTPRPDDITGAELGPHHASTALATLTSSCAMHKSFCAYIAVQP